jgi:hypothetical protein
VQAVLTNLGFPKRKDDTTATSSIEDGLHWLLCEVRGPRSSICPDSTTVAALIIEPLRVFFFGEKA